jgi:2-oxoglutarate ferredoxin oxidoreductase subunit delta
MAETKVTTARPKYRVVIDQEWCKGCGICISFCPKGMLVAEGLDQKARVTDESLCTGCKMCEVHCPDFGISVVEVDL